MQVKVELFASFREGRFVKEDREYAPAATVADVVSDLAIEGKVAIIFLNGRHARPDQPLSDGDTLALFPPIGGG
jgi:molybdopterin converting factor small subunit